MDPMYIERLRGMEDEANRINAFLADDHQSDPDAISQRLSLISGYNARTGEMLAEAEYILSIWKGEVLEQLLELDPKMPANTQKTLVEAKCAYGIKVCRLLERTNRSTVHSGEVGITQLSYAKEEMSLSRKGY